MPRPYAAGSKAFGFCDRCGFREPLGELKDEVVDLEKTGMLVCSECFDPDHPQNQLGRWPVDDPQALRNPRPDSGLSGSRFTDGINVSYDFSSGTSTSYTSGVNTYNGIDNWVYHGNGESGGAPVSNMVWNPGSWTVSLSTTKTSSSYTQLWYDKARNPSATPSVDPLIYKVCTLRIRRTSSGGRSAANTGWNGTMFFRTDPGAANPYQGNQFAPEPVWDHTGDDWVLLSWDMSNNSTWNTASDKITGWEIRLDSGTGTGAHPEYELDWVKFMPK